MIVGYQGEPGAFSEEAALARFGSAPTHGYVTFALLVQALARGEITHAVLPMHNTIVGTLGEVHALMSTYPKLMRTGEITHRIVQCLIGTPGSSIDGIQYVLSHPVALGQCRSLLSRFTDVAVDDTAGAVRAIIERGDPRYAAIGPARAAQRYGGIVLATGVQDAAENVTRFAIVQRRG